MRRFGSMIAAGLISLPLSAKADIVRFDVEAHCTQIAGFGGNFSHEMFNFCISAEQDAYDGLKGRWSSIAPTITAHCVEIASFAGPGSYEMLQFCINEEEQAASSTPAFKY